MVKKHDKQNVITSISIMKGILCGYILINVGIINSSHI